MSKFVNIYNETTGGTASVTLKAFEQVWSSLGWTLASDTQNLQVEESFTFQEYEDLEDEENPNSDETEKEEKF